MNIEKIKEMLKNKKVIAASLAVISLVLIGAITGGIVHNKNKVEDNKVVTVNKEDTKEKEVKKELEDLNKIDISKLAEEDKKSIEDTKKLIEEMISNKEYDKARRAIDSVKTNIDNKFKEIAENEKDKEEVKEESKEEKVEENKEVTSNDTTSNSTSSNTSSNTSENSGNTSSSNQEVVQQPTTPPVVEEKPVQSTPTPEPTPQPPVVEETKPVYPSVAEVQQRLIAYGQSLGLTYDPSINSGTEGTVMQGTEQMWGNGLGGNADCQTLFNGLVSAGCYAFNVEVVDLGNGFCSMKAYGIINWD